MDGKADDFVLEHRDDGWIVAGYTGGDPEVFVPSEIDGEPVILIAKGAFEDNNVIESIEVPETVTFIGNQGFSDCRSLKRATIKGPINMLNFDTFHNCPALVDVSLPDSLVTVGAGAFSNCSALTSVAIPSSVTVIADRSFTGCASLQTMVVPENVETIERSAFRDCPNLATVVVHEKLSYIGPRAFQGCPKLKSVTIVGENIDTTLSSFLNNHSMSYLIADYAIERNLVSFDQAKKLLRSELEQERLFGARLVARHPERLGEIHEKLEMVKALSAYGCTDELRALADKRGFLGAYHLKKCIDAANANGQTETIAFLLDLSAAQGGPAVTRTDSLRL